MDPLWRLCFHPGLSVCLFVCQQDDTETTKLDFNRTWMLAKNRPHSLFVHFSLNNAWNLMKKKKSGMFRCIYEWALYTSKTVLNCVDSISLQFVQSWTYYPLLLKIRLQIYFEGEICKIQSEIWSKTSMFGAAVNHLCTVTPCGQTGILQSLDAVFSSSLVSTGRQLRLNICKTIFA